MIPFADLLPEPEIVANQPSSKARTLVLSTAVVEISRPNDSHRRMGWKRMEQMDTMND